VALALGLGLGLGGGVGERVGVGLCPGGVVGVDVGVGVARAGVDAAAPSGSAKSVRRATAAIASAILRAGSPVKTGES
jgi:hypothetical protein